MWPSHFGPRSLPCSSRQPSRSGLFAPHRAPPNTPMTTRWLLAGLHLLALGIGLGAVWARGRALRGDLDGPGLRRVFYADTWWGVAALVWIGTGLVRAFGGFEKGSFYYLHNHLFWTKMGLLAAILILEVGPMIALIRLRVAVARGSVPHTPPP